MMHPGLQQLQRCQSDTDRETEKQVFVISKSQKHIAESSNTVYWVKIPVDDILKQFSYFS